ncbi:MAG: recombination regulator RecX [Lachnospiraceae bacterium]|nr:recombination regulator RecX [Lachnospiraceae bacterium]
MIITELRPNGRGKRLVFLDGEAAFCLTASETEEYGLSEGADLSGSLYELLLKEVLYKRCKSRVLHLLDRADRTESEIRKRLSEEYYPESVIDATVEAAKNGRYLDDERYANQYVYEKSRRKSRRMIRAELESKGLDRELIDKALSEIPEEEEEAVIERELLKKTGGRLSEDYNEKQKLLAALSRKGFEPGRCVKVYERLLERGAETDL